MTDKELKKLDKSELLQILVDVSKENDRLKAENSCLKEDNQSLKMQLEAKTLQIQEAGSIAEAALRVNGVFEAAQKAADDYLKEVRTMNEHCREDYRRIITEASNQALRIVDEAEKTKAHRIAEADAYWKRLTERLNKFSSDHEWFSKWMKEENR